MIRLVFFLEEPSAEEMLKEILPKILPDHVEPRFIVFEGKQDLEKQLHKRMKHWRMANSRFIVLRDQDAGDCFIIKQSLLEKCKKATPNETIVRIACHELESFYIGDLKAVEKGLGINGLARLQGKKKFREPDRLSNPAQELIRLTKNRYQKVSGSREIAKHMNLTNNISHSFNVFLKGIERIISISGNINEAP